ncbi:MAG: GNAT family N-acetyltransferase, partial [Bacteroidetes bacterium]|nr:GNAT family N-acetyltransferase [Bacteroidota bacterium]
GLLRLVDALCAEGQVRLFTATPHDAETPEGGLAVLHDGRTAHYWIAGSAPGPAMTVLLGHTLPRLRDDGIEQFDFVGANTPSIAEFKRHFGPVLTPYFFLEKITRPELRLLYRLKGRKGHF